MGLGLKNLLPFYYLILSFNLRNIREVSNDPLAKFTNQIAKQLSAFLTKDQIDALEDQEDIYADGQDIDTVVKFHDELEFNNKFDLTTLYYPIFEPDGTYLTLWLRGRNLGNTTKDWTPVRQDGTIHGDPLLIDGTPFNSGINVGGGGIRSTCVRFNRPTSAFVNTEYISVGDNSQQQVSGIATGISYFIRFRLKDLATQGGVSRTIFEKIDDSTPNNGVILRVSSSGRLLIFIKRSGTEYNWETDAGVIAMDTVYDVWVTYAVSGNAVKIYVNNVDQTLSAGSSASWHSGLSNHDLAIFARGGTSTNGFVYGDFYDFRVYREKVVSTAEVGYMNTNKWTIADIPFGQCMIADYFSSSP